MIHWPLRSASPRRATVVTSGGTYRQRDASVAENPALPARVSEPSVPAAHTATATAPSGRSACSSSESATACASDAASAPLSAARSRTAAASRSAAPRPVAAARKASVTSDIRSRAAWLMTSTANSSGVTRACSVSSASCRAACAGPQPSRSTRMPLASSIRARPSASAWAARTSRRSRSTVAASLPTGEVGEASAGSPSAAAPGPSGAAAAAPAAGTGNGGPAAVGGTACGPPGASGGPGRASAARR
ncbi:hypothetical protein GCM10020295_13940 [Streptomyces cinereospinus]